MPNTEPLPLPGTFTPVFDLLLRELGLSSALVYGVIWRCCQMEQHACRASLETLAKRTRLSRSSVIRHIKTLLRQGYITDLTPNLKHAPHTYLVGRDPGIPTDAPMPEDADGSDGQAVQGCQKVHSEGTQDYPRCDKTSQQVCQNFTPGVTEFHTRCDKTSQQVCQNVAPGVTNCHTNKTLLREYLRDDRREAQAPNFSKPSKTLLEAVRVSSQ
jgi:DNA-binding Lrp family transcriptional regulator